MSQNILSTLFEAALPVLIFNRLLKFVPASTGFAG